MNLERITNQMAANAKAVDALLRGVSDAQASWQPNAESWSMLFVICHLYDEEREDFRQRVDYTLHHPAKDWPPIDPQGWVVSRAYHSRDFRGMLNAWLEERAQSLEWLATLRDANWDAERMAPWRAMRAGDVMAAWLAHDFLHIRQINELHYAWHAAQSAPYTVEYAGEW